MSLIRVGNNWIDPNYPHLSMRCQEIEGVYRYTLYDDKHARFQFFDSLHEIPEDRLYELSFLPLKELSEAQVMDKKEKKE